MAAGRWLFYRQFVILGLTLNGPAKRSSSNLSVCPSVFHADPQALRLLCWLRPFSWLPVLLDLPQFHVYPPAAQSDGHPAVVTVATYIPYLDGSCFLSVNCVVLSDCLVALRSSSAVGLSLQHVIYLYCQRGPICLANGAGCTPVHSMSDLWWTKWHWDRLSDLRSPRTTSLNTTRPSPIFYRLLLNWASLRRH
jgi:hypothetical protein